MNTELCWHTPPNCAPRAIDGMIQEADGTLRGRFSGDTFEELQARYPGARLGGYDEYTIEHDAALRTVPKQCSEEEWFAALDCMPPLNWRRAGGIESFMMEERLSGSITRIYALDRASGRYWSFNDRDDMTAQAIADKIREASC